MDEIGRSSASLAALAPRVRQAWYVMAWSHEVAAAPVVRALFGLPVVLWRGRSGAVSAVLDRCPHRSVPLSSGRVLGDELACGYHGWQFDGGGRCTRVPGLAGEAAHKTREVAAFPVVEQQGCVWVWGDPETPPRGAPFRFRLADDPQYLTVRHEVRARGSVHAVVENALDVPHTAFLHGGLFREDGERRPIRCDLARYHDRVECEYVGEARPEGLVARLLSPSGGEVTHFDRFFLPSITEVEYRIGEENHIVLNGACTPSSDWDTRLYAVVCARTRLPNWLVSLLVKPLALRIFGQDAVILDQQTTTLHAFGEGTFSSTELDLLGPHILRLMTRAAKGEDGDPGAEPYRKSITMMV